MTGVGKVDDLFAKHGLSVCHHTVDNAVATDKVVELLQDEGEGMILANLIEFDMVYGHRNNPEGYGRALEAFDSELPRIMEAMKPGDVLFIAADHGNDPTTPSTDHSREYVPILVYGERVKPGVNLGTRESFADLGATVAALFDIDPLPHGTPFLTEIVTSG